MSVKVAHKNGTRSVSKVFDNWCEARDYLRTLKGVPMFFWLKAESEDGLRFTYRIDCLSEYCNSKELQNFLLE